MQRGTRLKSVTCPFCTYSFLSHSSKRKIRLRVCPYCHKGFFHSRRRYYIAINDITKLGPQILRAVSLILKNRIDI